MSKEQKAPAEPRPMGRTVRATRLGFYRANLCPPGTTFALLKPEDFSDRWMDYADDAEDQLAGVDRGRPVHAAAATRKQAATPVAGRNSHVI